MFDDFAANGSVASDDGDRSSMEVSPDHGLKVGDMVWGKVKSHPWWPGHIFSEELATPSVRRSKRDGLLLVAFFGDSSYGWFDPSEITPFDSNFAEKSRQTNSKTFVRAVEEAIYEVSRRSALGLSCMCRNKQNFRETDVKGYFAVDVTDYEPGAVYSIDTVQKARDSFKPNLALDFVRQLALEPTGSMHNSIDFIKNKANVISYRRAVYEEFDETYLQAFGYDVNSSSGSVQESASRKSPKAKAPLSGRQVFADTSNKGKSCNKGKDKYLLKRRDEPKQVKVQKKEKLKLTSSPHVEEDSITVPAGDYVLQKRLLAADQSLVIDDELPSIDAIQKVEEEEKVDDINVDDKRIVSQMDDTNTNSDLLDDNKVVTPKNGPKKVKVSKQPVSEPDSEKPLLPEKKKKRKKQHLMSSDDGTSTTRAVPVADKVLPKKPEDQNGPDSKPTEFSRLLDDLHSFALDPFQAINRGRVVKTRRVFLNFRSLVFKKSLKLSTSASEDDSSKSLENGRKRAPSDRQEEMAAKKKKKVGDIRNLTNEKKIVEKPEYVKKTEQRAPYEPTMLNMKFPTGGSLPSINELKARFARYGPLDHSSTKIFWNTSTCRVVYRHKADAQAAQRFVVGSGGLFGHTGVKCTLKEVGEPAPVKPPVKPPKEDHEKRPPPATATTPGLQPKSILKKSGGEEAAGNGGRGWVKFMLGGEESQIKSNTKMENKNGALFSSSTSSYANMDFSSTNFQKGVSSTSITSSLSGQFTSSRLPPLLPTPTQPPISMNYGTPLAQPPPPPPRSLNYGSEMTKLTPKPPLLPPLPGVFVHNLQRPNIGPPKVDVSQQMLSLLRKCNEVVTNVSSVLGYVPYRPL